MGDTIRLEAEPRSVGRARRFCAATLHGWGVRGPVVETCVLLVSELATNAVLHARTDFTVSIEREPRLRIEVCDGDPRLPHTRDFGPEAASGRGLHLVEALAVSSGTVTHPTGGKSVWFELPWGEERAG
ncbi:ATP-binding protein [Iamia sp. SCSIO 61187]|uniref:ATP-binding protein n=1 Tax=Iamia sp. SCSIO 61187 TaxID=2722752 RepID=UPI001C62DC3E|nr:ATP-binding protein [Iamia sp. SCSIO 61187]QYG92183.1 ATP-binding protein [Iamia sp. SCSIO 61187]